MQDIHGHCNFLRKYTIDFLASNAEGGAFAPSKNALPNPMTTAEVVSAGYECGIHSEGWCQSSVDYLLKSQRADGSWTDQNSGDPWDVSSTAWALYALQKVLSPLAFEACKRGTGWLRSAVLSMGGCQRTYSILNPTHMRLRMACVLYKMKLKR